MELVNQALSEPRGGGTPRPHEGAASREVARGMPAWVERLYLARPPYVVVLGSAALCVVLLLLVQPDILYPDQSLSLARVSLVVATAAGATALILAWRHMKP